MYLPAGTQTNIGILIKGDPAEFISESSLDIFQHTGGTIAIINSLTMISQKLRKS